jgi:hypothetical protein
VPVKTYDPRSVLTSFRDQRLSGFSDGDMLSFTIPEAFLLHVGTDGRVSRIATNNVGIPFVVRLAQTSDSNDVLSAFFQSDRAAPNGAGVGPFVVSDLLGRTKIRLNAWISKAPDLAFGAGNAPREWQFQGELVELVVGGNG